MLSSISSISIYTEFKFQLWSIVDLPLTPEITDFVPKNETNSALEYVRGRFDCYFCQDQVLCTSHIGLFIYLGHPHRKT